MNIRKDESDFYFPELAAGFEKVKDIKVGRWRDVELKPSPKFTAPEIESERENIVHQLFNAQSEPITKRSTAQSQRTIEELNQRMNEMDEHIRAVTENYYIETMSRAGSWNRPFETYHISDIAKEKLKRMDESSLFYWDLPTEILTSANGKESLIKDEILLVRPDFLYYKEFQDVKGPTLLQAIYNGVHSKDLRIVQITRKLLQEGVWDLCRDKTIEKNCVKILELWPDFVSAPDEIMQYAIYMDQTGILVKLMEHCIHLSSLYNRDARDDVYLLHLYALKKAQHPEISIPVLERELWLNEIGSFTRPMSKEEAIQRGITATEFFTDKASIDALEALQKRIHHFIAKYNVMAKDESGTVEELNSGGVVFTNDNKRACIRLFADVKFFSFNVSLEGKIEDTSGDVRKIVALPDPQFNQWIVTHLKQAKGFKFVINGHFATERLPKSLF